MRPLSHILVDLIGFAEETITRPARPPNLAPDGMFATLACEVRHADALPAENIRATRAALIMVVALDGFFASDRSTTSLWLAIAGATLPQLRGEAWLTRRNEMEARGT